MSWPPTDGMLAEMALLDESAMPSVCRRGRRTKSVSNGRIVYGTTVSYGSTMPCRVSMSLQPSEGNEQVGRTGWETMADIATPLGSDVVAGDWLEATTEPNGVPTTQVWEVVAEPKRTSYATSHRCTARRVG